MVNRIKLSEVRVLKRTIVAICLLTVGLSLGGCSKCGWWWDDWVSPTRACKGDFPK